MRQNSPTRRKLPTPLVADEDLSTPIHDAIMLWLDANLATTVPNVGSQTGWWRSPGHGWKQEAVDDAIDGCHRWWDGQNGESAAVAAKAVPPCPSADWTPERARWSTDARRWVRDNLASLVGGVPPGPGHGVGERTWEFPVVRAGGFIVGYIDLAAEVTQPCLRARQGKLVATQEPAGSVFFEVKSRIRSIGEVIRQIRAYETVLGAGRCAVVCPDDRFAETIRAQRIAFVKAPREALELP